MKKTLKVTFVLFVMAVFAFSMTMFAGAETTNVIGDVNGDSLIAAEDARLALRAAVGLENLTDAQFKSADVNNDNKVTAFDARTILRVSVGLEKFEDISDEDFNTFQEIRESIESLSSKEQVVIILEEEILKGNVKNYQVSED